MTRRNGARLAGDLVAGLGVALVVVPQALAYAELAGLPAATGLVAASLPSIAAALFASSPYLQTGPTAMTALLTFGILAPFYTLQSPAYVGAAALLALLVGLVRIGLGLARFGAIAYFMSQPVLKGFTSAAALLIILSQLPTALGVVPESSGVLAGALEALVHPDRWHPWAIAFTLGTLALVAGARRISPLIPGVLVAAVLAGAASVLFDYGGPVIGEVTAAWPRPQLALPWGELQHLALGAVVIAIVGFAEPASIARAYAGRRAWDPDRELLSQGSANLVSGLFGAFPVGASFSRSALNRSAGAQSRLSGLVTGVAVLLFLPFAGLLAPIPKAVLAAIVIGAVAGLLQFPALLQLWRYARLQSLTAYATFALTLALAPRIDVAVVIGIGLAIAAHLYREMELGIEVEVEGAEMVMRLSGVLWFGSAQLFELRLRELLPPPPGVERLRIEAGALGRVDLSGSLLLADLLRDAERHGLEVEITGLEPHMRRVLERVRRG